MAKMVGFGVLTTRIGRARYCQSIMREISWRISPDGRDGGEGEEAFAAGRSQTQRLGAPESLDLQSPHDPPGPKD